MNDETSANMPPDPGGANRREYFRIDDVLPVTVRKFAGILPEAKIVPVSLLSSGPRSTGLSMSGREFDPTLPLLLLEMESKIDLLSSEERKESPPQDGIAGIVSVKQLLLRLNASLDHLLDAQGIARPDDSTRVSNVSLSGGGIKLETSCELVAGDGVEVRMLLDPGEPVWVVAYGVVIRSTLLPEGGGNEVAITFNGMQESVRDTIIHYALRKQKEQILSRG